MNGKKPNTVEIYKGQDFYVPSFELKLHGRTLSKEIVRDVIQVSYRDNIQEVDSFEVTINNWDAEKRDFKYSDDHRFDPGEKIELWMGYFGKDPLRLMIKGEITSLRPTFPTSGQPTLAISGLNVLHRLRSKQESHAYVKMNDSQIARQIGGRLGVEINTDEVSKVEQYNYLFQDNQYDIVFLMERARHIGCEIMVEENGQNGQSQPSALRFIPSVNVKRTNYKLKFGRDLIEFRPELTTARQVGEVTVRGWDAKNKRPIVATATRSQIRTKGVGRRGGQAAIEQSFNQRKEIIVNHPIESEAEARTLARETLERIAKDMVKGSGSSVGLPDLRAGSILFIEGLGDRFTGRYFVTATTHAIGDSGYTTQFECRREETEDK